MEELNQSDDDTIDQDVSSLTSFEEFHTEKLSVDSALPSWASYSEPGSEEEVKTQIAAKANLDEIRIQQQKKSFEELLAEQLQLNTG